MQQRFDGTWSLKLWKALYLFVGRLEHIDRLALAADTLMRGLAPDHRDWFFIRFPEAGLHIRIRIGERVLGCYPALRERLTTECLSLAEQESASEAVMKFGHADESGRRFQPGEYCEPAYEPEITRYGGQVALAENERLFRTSTAVAIAAISRTGDDRQKRLDVATDLMLVTALAMEEFIEPRRFMADYARSWREFWPGTPTLDAGQLPAAGALVARMNGLQRLLADKEPPKALTAAWGQALIRSKQQFRAVFESGQLVSPASGLLASSEQDFSAAVRSMFTSQLHMLNNRLGFWPDTEILMGEWLDTALFQH